MGYGEYKDITISDVTLYQTYSKANSFVAVVGLRDDDYSVNLHIFKTPTSIKELTGINSLVCGERYKESVIIENCCYTMAGDTIFVANDYFYYNNPGELYLITPVSYREDIYTHKDTNGFCIAKRNHELGEDMWSVEIKELSNEPSNAKMEVSIIDNSTNVWEYKVNVTHYDGTKKEHTFKINIDNGKVI